MKLKGLTRKQIRKRLGELNDKVNDRFVDLLIEGGYADTNDVPYWRWKEMIAEANQISPDSVGLNQKPNAQNE